MKLNLSSVTTFDGREIPSRSRLAGYAALMEGLGARAPAPARPSVVSEDKIKPDVGSNHSLRQGFRVWPASYGPAEDTFDGHLEFALKNERTDLLALKRILDRVPGIVMEDFVRAAPTGGLRRKGWFLFEWLTGRKLDLPDAEAGKVVAAIDPEAFHVAEGTVSRRHRVLDNLPGVPGYCHLVGVEAGLGDVTAEKVAGRIAGMRTSVGEDMLARVSRRLLLKDSKSTYQIEQENPGPDALQKWSEAVAAAGRGPLTEKRLLEMQELIVKDKRFITVGRRKDGVFLGDRVNDVPDPKWIGARPEDFDALMDGFFAMNERLGRDGVHPVVHAAVVSFGWIYGHFLEDGNGRTGRFALQSVLAARGMAAGGVTLPVSKSIWNDIDGYHRVFQKNDGAKMPFIDWRPTPSGNVEVLNDTRDLYAYGDMTGEAAFIGKRVAATLLKDFPEEIEEVVKRDRAVEGLKRIVEMPDSKAELFAMFVSQNGGTLSRNRRKKDFNLLDDHEVEAMEDVVRDVYDLEPPQSAPTP